MSALRFTALAVVFVGLAAAADYTGAGCPTSPAATALFGNSSVTCTAAATCQSTYCSCIGAAAPTNWTCGAYTSSAPNCSHAAWCVTKKIMCINAAADSGSAGCTILKDLKMSNLAVAGGQQYNLSAAYKACKAEACMLLNSTSGNCSIDYTTLCASPVKYTGSMKLTGDFSVYFSNATKKASLIAAIEADLSRAFGFPVKVTKFVACAKRRRAGETCLVVEFEVAGVSGNNDVLKARLAAVKDGAFLTSTKAAYKAETGSDLTFVGITAGGASSATFSGSGSASGSTTSSSTTTSTTTGSGATATSGTTATGSGSNGAATQSLLVAVVVAVLGAMMF